MMAMISMFPRVGVGLAFVTTGAGGRCGACFEGASLLIVLVAELCKVVIPSIHLSVDTWVVSVSWLLRTVLQ